MLTLFVPDNSRYDKLLLFSPTCAETVSVQVCSDGRAAVLDVQNFLILIHHLSYIHNNTEHGECCDDQFDQINHEQLCT